MPARLRDLARVLEECGISVEKPSSGSHWKAKGPNGKTFPLACHNGPKTELDDKYIKGVCRCFGIDYADFKKKL